MNTVEIEENKEFTFGVMGFDFHFDNDFVPYFVEVTKNGSWIAEIGLEFDGICLTGYDGIFELPQRIIDCLEFMGYKIDL